METTTREEFASLYPLIRHIARRRITRSLALAGISNPTELQDRLDNAIAHSWVLYCRHRPTMESARECAVKAASLAARKTHLVGGTRRPGYVDAMDRRDFRKVDLSTVPVDTELRQRDDSDAQSRLLDSLPAVLRPIAVLLMAGLSRVEIARRRHCSPATITRRCDSIAELIG